MFGFLLVLLIIDGIFLSVVVLLQSGKGGGLAAMGGGAASPTEGILGGRQATTVLTRATWTAGSIFMLLALVLSIMSSRAQEPESILRQETQATVPSAQPILNTLDQGEEGANEVDGGNSPSDKNEDNN